MPCDALSARFATDLVSFGALLMFGRSGSTISVIVSSGAWYFSESNFCGTRSWCKQKRGWTVVVPSSSAGSWAMYAMLRCARNPRPGIDSDTSGQRWTLRFRTWKQSRAYIQVSKMPLLGCRSKHRLRPQLCPLGFGSLHAVCGHAADAFTTSRKSLLF